jgi:hypothetical protein
MKDDFSLRAIFRRLLRIKLEGRVRDEPRFGIGLRQSGPLFSTVS